MTQTNEERIQIKAQKVVDAIRAGIDDESIMDEHNLNAETVRKIREVVMASEPKTQDIVV